MTDYYRCPKCGITTIKYDTEDAYDILMHLEAHLREFDLNERQG